MNYYAYINGKTHRIVQGSTVSEEYNETLDSATIIISNSPQLDIDPYDDVFIFGEWCGKYDQVNDCIVPVEGKKFNFIGYPVDSTNYAAADMPCFYKHFLVDQFTESIIVLGKTEADTRYQYTIELFSETKGLETVQAPNISITQPLNEKVPTVEYVRRYLELYNKKMKKTNSGLSNWSVANKYQMGDVSRIRYLNLNGSEVAVPGLLENIADSFGNSYTPDFPLNNPSLRDILNKLLITKDKIAVVKDDKIYAMDITLRRGKFNLNKGKINYISGSKSSDNYCTNLKRTYSDGLAQDSTGRYVEYLGFRNSDNALLTLSNMRVETGFPIYKINKFYMCYYKKCKVTDSTNHVSKDGVFLCKQDITDLIKLNSERNTLSVDIRSFNSNPPKTIKALSKYKLATLGYDIGSKTIDGWGVEFSYPNSFLWQSVTKSYLEVIFDYVDSINPYGIYGQDFVVKKILNLDNVPQVSQIFVSFYKSAENIIPIPNYSEFSNDFKQQIQNLFNNTGDANNMVLHLKHIFFQIDYTPFYSGSIIQSKTLGKSDVTINDNQATSLSLLEIDGLAQQEKINRFGNKGIQINARYTTPEHIQKLGSVFDKGLDTDVVIYHKEYSLNDNDINCTYFGTKDYVLKNYFTTVFAKYRTYNLMSYSESVLRPENEHIYLLLSKTRKYSDNNFEEVFSDFDINFNKKFLSFYKTTSNILYKGLIINNDKINYGYLKKGDKYYTADTNIFVSGHSLCFNIAMKDNVTLGNYIKDMHNEYIEKNENNYMMGGLQDYVWLTDDANDNDGGKTGFLTSLGFYFGHINNSSQGDITGLGPFIDDEQILRPESRFYSLQIETFYYRLFNLPQLPSSAIDTITNKIGFEKNIYKDNKERIDMTIQIEPIKDEGVYFSQWLTKLGDLFGVFQKFDENISYNYFDYSASDFLSVIAMTNSSNDSSFSSVNFRNPGMVLLANEKKLSNRLIISAFASGPIVFEYEFDGNTTDFNSSRDITSMKISLNSYIVANGITQTKDVLGNLVITGDAEATEFSYTPDSFVVPAIETGFYLEYNGLKARVVEIYSDTNIIVLEKPLSVNALNNVTVQVVKKYNYEFDVYGDIKLTRNSEETSLTDKIFHFSTKDVCPSQGLVYEYDSGANNLSLSNDSPFLSISNDNNWRTKAILSALGIPETKINDYCIFSLYLTEEFYFSSSNWAVKPKIGNGFLSGPNPLYTQDYGIAYFAPNSGVKRENSEIVYHKNMFWVYSSPNYEFKDYMVYDELNNLEGFNELIVGTDISFSWPDNSCFRVSHPSLAEGSHIFCYYKNENTNKYNFVFGFKTNSGTYTDIYISPLTFRNLTVYDEKTNMPIGEVPNDVDD